MAIGHKTAKELLTGAGWELRVAMTGEKIENIEVYHPVAKFCYKVRLDSGRRLMAECEVTGRGGNDRIAILHYRSEEDRN